MKKMVYGIAVLSLFSSYTHQLAEKSKRFEKLTSALQEARKEIYTLVLTDEEMEHLADYFVFYLSWYAPVTPASKELYDSLSRKALDFVEKIKKIAKPLEKKPRKLMGASRLSYEGKLFYKKVIAMIHEKINMRK